MSNHSSNATADLFAPRKGLSTGLEATFLIPVLISMAMMYKFDHGTWKATNFLDVLFHKYRAKDWAQHREWTEARFKFLLLYFLGPILVWQSVVLVQELHYVPNPSVEQPSLCDAILRGCFCFATISDAGESFVDLDTVPKAFETQLHYLKKTHASMLLTCSAGDGMLNLPQEADYNTTKLPHAIPDNTTTQIAWADYQLFVICYEFQPHTVTGWLGAIGTATAALGALMGIYSQLDMLCSIGKFQSATESAATRNITGVFLTIFAVAIVIVFDLVALMFPFNALPPPPLAEIATAGMTAWFLLLCAYYVRGYGKFDRDNHPWEKLQEKFNTYADKETDKWTPQSTADYQKEAAADDFIKAIKTIPVQGGSYADADADHFTREQVWNATWQTLGKFRHSSVPEAFEGTEFTNSAFKSELGGKEDGMNLAGL